MGLTVSAPLQSTEKKSTRAGFGAGLLELGHNNPNVVALTADLAGSLQMNAFIDAYPDSILVNLYVN